MKTIVIFTTLVSSLSLSAAIISTEEHNLNTWQDEITTGTTMSATFMETFTGAWGSFDIDILVSSVIDNTTTPAAMVLSGTGLDLSQDDRDFTFTASLQNVSLNSGYSLLNLTFSEIKFNAAGSNNDSGTFTVAGNDFTWVEADAVQVGFPASSQNTSQSRFFPNELNGSANVTTFSHNYEPDANTGTATDSSYRINDLKATVQVDFIPEPSSSLLIGLAGLGLISRRKR